MRRELFPHMLFLNRLHLPRLIQNISRLPIHKTQAQALRQLVAFAPPSEAVSERLGRLPRPLCRCLHSGSTENWSRAPPMAAQPQSSLRPFSPTYTQTLWPYLCFSGSFPALFSSSSNLLRASSSWVSGLGAGLGGMVGSWMKGCEGWTTFRSWALTHGCTATGRSMERGRTMSWDSCFLAPEELHTNTKVLHRLPSHSAHVHIQMEHCFCSWTQALGCSLQHGCAVVSEGEGSTTQPAAPPEKVSGQCSTVFSSVQLRHWASNPSLTHRSPMCFRAGVKCTVETNPAKGSSTMDQIHSARSRPDVHCQAVSHCWAADVAAVCSSLPAPAALPMALARPQLPAEQPISATTVKQDKKQPWFPQ